MSQWYVYMLRCSDGTYYSGVTTDLDRRIKEHNGEGVAGKGAKYTKARRPVYLAYSELVTDRSAAQKREHALRQLTRAEKAELANHSRV
ncbi:MAG: GIY-YIG nuclease family protein [Candidatus Paceibacteria bacterium]